MKRRIAAALAVSGLLVSALSAAAHANDTTPFYAIDGAATSPTDQLATLRLWLGPNLDSAATLESPFGAASYADPKYSRPTTDLLGNTKPALVPNMRENVPDKGDNGRLYTGGGAISKTAGKLFFVETGTRAAKSGDPTSDGTYYYNYLGQQLPQPNGTDPWVNTLGFTRVVSGQQVTDSWTGTCSADAVVSANRSTVLSAGHCVAGPNYLAQHGNPPYTSVTMSKWIFIPGYRGLSPSGGDTSLAYAAPYGVWVATKVYTTPHWYNWVHSRDSRTSDNFDPNAMGYDFSAMTVVDPLRPDTPLQDVVGGQNVAFNSSMFQNITAFGYPQTPNTTTGQYFSGRSLATCTGPGTADVAITDLIGPGWDGAPGSPDHGVSCSLTDGASGGPMLYDYDPATGTGTQVSVNSFKEPFGTSGLTMMGPQFGTVVQNVYNAIQSTTP